MDATRSRILHAPGKLYAGTTNTTGPAPYGGTPLGKVQQLGFISVGTGVPVPSEGKGGFIDVIEPTNEHLLVFRLRGADDDALRLLFGGNFVAGPVSGHSRFTVPGPATPGDSALGRAVQLTYVPDDPVNVPAVVAYRCVAYVADSEPIPFSRSVEFEIPVAAMLIEDSRGLTADIGRLVDLTIP